jgi:hypothetical protein
MGYSANEKRTVAMKSLLDSDFQEEFVKFRQGAISLGVFQQWVERNYERLATQVSAGILLKLRRGNAQKVMASIAVLVPDCAKCGHICPRGPFTTRQEHAGCASKVEIAVKNGDLSRIPPPNWRPIDNSQLGADAYFECTACGSVWTLVEPERQDNGMWDRLA